MEFADGRLTLLSKIGEGGMSTVWKAMDNKLGRIVAVKILNKDFSSSGTDIAAFRKEERIMESIRHPGIVEAYDFAVYNNQWYLTMEYVDGYTFAQLLHRKQSVKEADCLLICESIAASLDYAWNSFGIVHCDIKPENIMINTEGVVKLTDLGISHEFQNLGDKVKAKDNITGTPDYISPEQIYGDVELDCRSDIYSLGATIYHLATGRVLFPAQDNDQKLHSHCNEEAQALDPRSYRPALTEGFAQLLETMLVKNRDYRLQSWREVFAMCKDVEAASKFNARTTPGNSSMALLKRL